MTFPNPKSPTDFAEEPENIIVGITTGLVSSAAVSCIFYRKGIKDSERTFRRLFLTFVSLKITQTVPTSRQRTPEHYDLKDLSHWLACASKVMSDAGYREDSKALEDTKRLIDAAPEIPDPTEEQKSQAEAEKKRWQEVIDIHINRIKNG